MSNIDWSQLITKAMKDAAAAALHLSEMKAELATRNTSAALQITRIKDRIDTIGYGIESGEADEADEVEMAALALVLPKWKSYKFSLGKVTAQASWPSAPKWPVAPPIPEISASPMRGAFDAV
ncbi:phage tail protein [Pseudomonas syringae group genomosp. 3]|uniref:Tail fiber assembly domain-containing protein n=1 Tax=Pseudomonas syringae pv. persicae TaxID=237306 RepID=A0AB38EGT0_9PSED|nr:phage tail protein [Pseudomonas syringae group genomosp. 3]SOQ11793.1 tail fiber assembly domain-containing protein [Pseudomonas syringae pv. persicae]SOQ11812.1 tail fiber assembly domain-containing protein [Pseudomonas syringae pv. persicae]